METGLLFVILHISKDVLLHIIIYNQLFGVNFQREGVTKLTTAISFFRAEECNILHLTIYPRHAYSKIARMALFIYLINIQCIYSCSTHTQ